MGRAAPMSRTLQVSWFLAAAALSINVDVVDEKSPFAKPHVAIPLYGEANVQSGVAMPSAPARVALNLNAPVEASTSAPLAGLPMGFIEVGPAVAKTDVHESTSWAVVMPITFELSLCTNAAAGGPVVWVFAPLAGMAMKTRLISRAAAEIAVTILRILYSFRCFCDEKRPRKTSPLP